MFRVHCKPSRYAARNEKGTATVELALCLPILAVVAFGSIETANTIFLQERLTSAAYEGARSATTPGQTTAGATTAANNVLTQFGISGGTVTITPSVSASTTAGTQVTVNVRAPLSSNVGMTPFVIGNIVTTVSATVVMIHQ
jgi:Flp pilus assembly protein TadG